jgi:hypothetical protein
MLESVFPLIVYVQRFLFRLAEQPEETKQNQSQKTLLMSHVFQADLQAGAAGCNAAGNGNEILVETLRECNVETHLGIQYSMDMYWWKVDGSARKIFLCIFFDFCFFLC